MPQLLQLADTHRALHALLEKHLQQVVLGEVDAARAAWLRFTTLLRAHSAAEDALLTPLFVELGLESTGCTAALLDAEHRKIGREVDAGDRRCADAPDSLDAEARLEWVRASRLLTELLDHHDQRERSGFFPALDAALNEAQRDSLWTEFRRRETAGA